MPHDGMSTEHLADLLAAVGRAIEHSGTARIRSWLTLMAAMPDAELEAIRDDAVVAGMEAGLEVDAVPCVLRMGLAVDPAPAPDEVPIVWRCMYLDPATTALEVMRSPLLAADRTTLTLHAAHALRRVAADIADTAGQWTREVAAALEAIGRHPSG